jgi:quinol monooxygenase YgiN
MSITALLDLQLKPGSPEASYQLIHDVLTDTRAFPGCLGVDVVIDTTDPLHVLAVERWESLEADAAYRAWRAGDGASNLGTVLAAAPILTKFESSDI